MNIALPGSPTDDDEQGGVQSPKRNAKYLGSTKPFSEDEPGSLGLEIRPCYFLMINHHHSWHWDFYP